MKKKYLILITVGVIVLVLLGINFVGGSKNPVSFTYNPQAWTKTTDNSSYYQYLEKHKKDNNATDVQLEKSIVIPAWNYDPSQTIAQFGKPLTGPDDTITEAAKAYLVSKTALTGLKDAFEDTLLYAPEQDQVGWSFQVETAGFYQISVRYYPIKGKSSSIERTLLINGETPFEGASFVFHRVWDNNPDSMRLDESGKLVFKQDVNGNDIKPNQVEKPTFRTVPLRDDLGYVTENYRFYFSAGVNTIALVAIKECILLDQIYIESVTRTPTYAEYKAKYANVSQETPSYSYRVEAENATSKSSPTLYPITDRSSYVTTPYSPKETKLNAIGGDNWKVLGDWISWEIEVPQDGFYNISMRAKQNLVRGLYSNRIVYIDGKIAFDELNYTLFAYSSDWQNVTLGNKDEAFLFYLTAGKHTITMEVTLGEYSTLIERIQGSIDYLNKLYRDIIKFTSPAPDPNRDYELTKRPGLDMVERMTWAANELADISKSIETISGTKSDKTGTIDTMVVQLRDFIDRPRDVPRRLSSFNTNISSLGTLLTTLREYPLTIDYIMVHTPDVKLPRANETFFQKIKKSLLSFWYSFFIDYSAISSTDTVEGRQTIEVWMSLGRDQANVIRNLIDQNFTPQTGIKVDLKLTGTDVLLKATLAGIGPHVAINVDSTLPVNYGLRDAVLDLREFPDYQDVIERNSLLSDEEFEKLDPALKEWRFNMSALRQFQFNGAAYALPEKQIFMMMFVRTDILDELGLLDKVPNTWDEVIGLVADLQAHQLQFYLPVNDAGASAINPIFVSMLYQMGGDLYINNDMETGLMEPVALDAFEYWTEFYTLYSFPKYANFLNRFRSGEMPLGIAYYEAYNTLSVFAPDLRGKWAFYPIPGIEKPLLDENGNQVVDDEGNPVTYIDRISTSVGTGVVILKQPALESEAAKMASWEFVKWWTSATTQVQFGREMEGILGSAARHATANMMALEQLAWPSADLKQLKFQWSQVREIPNVAGGYITGREVENAYRKVINNLVNAKETLYEYAQNIQNEIDRKRKEFNLPLATRSQ